MCAFKIWPKGIPAAGSFWNYNKEIKKDTAIYESLIRQVHQVSLCVYVCVCAHEWCVYWTLQITKALKYSNACKPELVHACCNYINQYVQTVNATLYLHV